MNQIVNPFSKKEIQMRHCVGELKGMRKIISYLWDENQAAFNHILFLKGNYKEWPDMLIWLKRNGKKGQSLVDFFANESPDGGGTHMGAIYILSRLKGLKFTEENINADELL